MLIKLHDLATLKTTMPGGETATIRGLYLTEDLHVRAIAADLGGLFDLSTVAIPADAFGTPDIDAGSWPADVPTDAIRTCASVGERPASALEAIREVVLSPLPDHHDGLRSAATYKGLQLDVSEGPAGRVLDLVIDTDTMTAPFLVVETGSWLPERQVLLPTARLSKVDWSDNTAHIDATQDDIKAAPDVFKNDRLTTKGSGTLLTYYGLSA